MKRSSRTWTLAAALTLALGAGVAGAQTGTGSTAGPAGKSNMDSSTGTAGVCCSPASTAGAEITSTRSTHDRSPFTVSRKRTRSPDVSLVVRAAPFRSKAIAIAFMKPGKASWEFGGDGIVPQNQTGRRVMLRARGARRDSYERRNGSTRS